MNNIIGNTPYRNIQNKKYIDSTAEYIGKLADFLDKEQIPYSGRISEYKSTITVSGDENFKRASEILDKIKAENPRRFIGNTQYKYIRDKRIISMDADVVDKIAARLDSEHIMYSGIVEGKKGRITVGGSELEALVKGYIELERNGSAEIAYEIALTSDAYDDIYYICDQNGNAYYDEDGFAPTFNHVDDAERYAQIHHIPITVDETLMNHWREIEHTDKIRHDNSELVAAFPKSGEEYPDHFLYNAEGKSFQWIYYNPDGNFGEGEFVQKNIYEQDIIAAYNARITSPDEATGRNEFIYSLFSSCEETVISSDTEAFTAIAKEYINKPTGTIELYGIVENGTNISSIDMLISALEENCPAVLSEKEKTEDIVITENSDEIIIDGYEGTWYVVDTETVDGKELFLLENEEYGDETFGIIIDKDRNVLVGEAWNGFSDYHEKYDNITLEEKLANKVGDEWKAFLDDMKKESPAVLIESAYEISTKDNIQTYITEENLELTEKQINALLSSKNTLADLYDDWSSDEYLNSYSDVAELLKITADKLSEAIDRENLMLFRKENRECANMIDAMAAKHYENNSFKAEAALDELLEKYSFERIQTIAAANVVELYDRLQDRRISEENYNWGKSVLNALPDNYRVEMQPVGSNRLTMHTGLIDLLANRVREYEARSIEKEQPAPERTAEDISIGDRYRYKGADVEVVSLNGIYPNDVGISKTERMGNSEYAVTSNVDKYELHRNGKYLGNGEKAVVSELDMAKKYIGDYLDSEFSSEADFSDMKHISIGYTEIGSEEQGDHSLQMEADLENYSVSYFIDDELAKTEHYDSLEQMNRDHLSVLNFEDMLHVGTTELDRILEEKEKKVPVTAVLAVSQYDTSRYYIANDITEEAVRNAIANSDKLFMDLCALGGTQITEIEFAKYSQTEGIAAIDVNIDEQTMHVYGSENPIVSFKEIRGIDEISDALDLENNFVGSITDPTPEQREEITRKNNTLNSFFNNNPLAVFREIVKSAGLEPTEDITIGDTKEIFNSLKNTDISLMGYTYGLEFEPHDDRLSVTDTASGRTSEFIWGHAKELMYLIANENNISRENLIYNEVMRGTGFEGGKFRVADFYQANPSKKDFADFLKNEYGIGGHSGDGPVKFADHDSKGIEITLTTGKENFTWNEVAKVISELIEKGEYITQEDIDNRIRRAKLTIDNANEHTDFTSLVHAHEVLQKYGIENPPQDNEYKIYQLKNSPENHAIRFEEYALAEKYGEPAKPENYDLVYSGSLDEFEDENKLEAIYTKFNLNRPEDFKGHSLSVSDIIVMNDEAHYVDSFGFVDVSDKFLGKEKEQINLNDYEKISLVRRTEWNDRDLSDAENPAFEEITASYTPDDDGSFTKYAFNRTNSISVDVWEDENSVSGEDMLAEIEAHLKNMRSGVSSSEYYIELIDHDGNTRRLENNYFTFIHGEMAGIVEKSDSPEGKSAIKSKYTITNEKNSYMIVDDVRHAIDELSNGSDDEYDWTAFLTAYKSVMEANVQSDIALPLYKSGADKILSKANSNDTETISKSDYQNALACLDMVLKNGHLLKNPEEKEIEQFSFFSPRSNYISTDEIKPINVSHKNTEKENPITTKQDSITFSQPGSVNYTITESTFSNLGGDKTRCQNNIAAIRLLKQIEREKRSATPDEQQILAKYIGWGGLANAFDSSKTDWSKEYAELKTLLTPEEYSSARSSTLNAHYTSYTIISSIYSALDNMGFKGGKILEPALGTGNFFGSMPEEMRNNSQLSGVELDSITGRIAKLLYPSANIQIKGYEDTNFENNSFDVAVSNVPFGSYKVNDKEYNKQNMLIHDYFFSKTLDKVRPGGIIAFVTSKGTLDKENSEVRKYLAERAELLGAIRLPNTAFKNNAGTEVTSDIIFLQKREKPISVEQNTPDWVFKDILDNGIAVNKYFADHPEMILGQMAEGNKMFGNGTTCIPFDGADLKEQLAAAIHNIKGKYNKTVKSAERENASHADTVSCPPDAPKYSYVISDDKLYYHKAGDTMELVDTKDTDRIKAMTQLRDGVHELLDLQINNYNGENEVKISDAQNKLSKDYDDFVDRFGRIGQAENKKAFANDNSYHLIKSLEKTDNSGNFIGKADIFSKKTINPQIVIDHCNNAQDALILSLSEKMRVDMDYMSMLTDKSESELVAELGDKIYQNPQKNMHWESADEYLTGNIRAKLAAAEEAGLERNIEALRAVMPQRIEAADISVKLGSAWIDPEYIRQFILETLKPDFQTRNSIEVIYSEATDKWKVEGYQHSYGNTLATETYGTSDMNAYEIIEVSLNMKKAEIRERVKDENGIEIKDEKGRYVLAVNQDKTMVVQSKQDELKKKFKDWIFATPERREKLTNLYNEKFNSVRLREYDGSHLNFVGMNSNIALKPHQKNAVARSLYSNGNTLIAHEVGAGKTFEMVAIAMEGKRLGLHSKPLITAPNALTEQWGDAFRTLYPNSNVLVATEKDFKPENRRDLFAKIATGDWDAVIIGHSQFDMIHLSRERELETLYSEVDKLEAALDEISATSNKGSYSVKQVERAIKSYTDKIQKLLEKTPKEDMLCFEQLGIDKIFVDESQAYKNLDTPTKMQNVSGIGSGGSGRSMQLLMKCRYLDEVTGGKGVIFASGTPISNSMSEMYTLMRYLQADKLRELGINSFDRWASIFGETTTSMELSPEANGKYQMKTRFAKFQNLPELMNIFKECADIKTAATLNLDRPDFEMHNINVPATKMQAKMIKNLGERAKLIRAGAVDPTEDNMCKLTVDGRKIGLDQRCMNPSLPDDPNSKVNVCINNVFDIWKQTAEKKSTQLIFCDLATPQAAVNENTYTLYRKDTKGEYAPVYSAKLGQKDTADKIFKKLTGSKPPKNFKAGGVFDGDIIMLHTVDYDTMTASNSAVMASNGKISEIPEEMWTKLHHSPTETFESERKFCVYDDIKQKLVAKGIPEKEIAFIHDADTTEEKQKLFAKMNKGEIRVMIGSTQKCGAGMNAQERMIALHDLDAPMRPSDMEQRHGRIIRQGNTNTKVDIYRYTTDKTFDAYLYQMLENKQKFISQIMTDKSPVRSCEDVDEIALDYAEVKALCAGNPLIKEKIDLETEITKLNVLKSSFLSQKYAVQDKAYTILPREKSVKETYIDKLKKDVEFAEKEQPLQNEDGKNYYPVTVGDKKYHEKDAAGEAIRQAILDNKDILQGKEVHIGSYRGFEMTAFLDVFSKKIKVNLKGATNHYGELNMDINVKAGGNIIRLDNVINSIGITLMKEEEGLQAICADIEQAKAAADAVFPQEQELAAKEKRLEEVNAQLASIKVNTQDRSSELYAALVDICPALQYSKEFHCKYEAGEGIEPLCIERNGDVVFVAHTYTQNGDLMYDPAIELYFDSKNQKAEALSYELSGMGMYQDFRDGNLPNEKADVEEMALETMFPNIKDYDYKLVETNIDTEIDEDERGEDKKEINR